MTWHCDICIETLHNQQSSDYIICTPCGHVFHFNCISDWFMNSKSCPNCREYCTHNELKKIFFSTQEYDTMPDIIHENNTNDEINFLKSVNESLQEQYDLLSGSNKALCDYKEKYDTIIMLNASLEEQLADLQLNMNKTTKEFQHLKVENLSKISTIDDLKKELHQSNSNVSELRRTNELNVKTLQCYKFDCDDKKKLLTAQCNAIKIMENINTANEIRINELELENNCLRSTVAKYENDLNLKQVIDENCFNELQYFQVEMKRIS